MNSLEGTASSNLFLCPARPVTKMKAKENVNTSNLPSVNEQEQKLVKLAFSILKNSQKQPLVKKKLDILEQVEKKQADLLLRYKELEKSKERMYLRIALCFYNNNLGNLGLLKSILFSHRTAGDVIELFKKNFKVDDKTESDVKYFLNLKTLATNAEKQLALKSTISAKVVKNGVLSNKKLIAFKK